MNAKYPNHVIICNFADVEEILKLKEYEGLEIRKSLVMPKGEFLVVDLEDFMNIDVQTNDFIKTL